MAVFKKSGSGAHVADRSMPSSVQSETLDPRRFVWMMLLVTATALSSIDRQIIGLLLEPIRGEFNLSDTELGILSGPAFTALYALVALPLAIISDRVSRKGVIAVSLATFSAMSALCGLAPSFIYLVIFRMGVAVGEAGVVPSSQALVADIYPKSRFTGAMSKLYISQSVGGVLAFLLGGILTTLVGWRWTLVIVGIPGIVIAFIAFLVLPANKTSQNAQPNKQRHNITIATSLKFLWSQRTYRYLTLGNFFWSFAGAGIALWAAPFIARTYGLPAHEIGMVMAVAIGLSGAGGLLIIGGLAQRNSVIDMRWILWIVTASLCVGVPFTVLTFQSPWGWVAMAAGCLVAFLTISTQGPVASTIQLLVPNEMRGIAVAVKHLVVTALGAGSGPLAVGILNDALAPEFGVAAIRYSLALASLMYLPAAYLFYLASKSLRAEAEIADNWRHSETTK